MSAEATGEVFCLFLSFERTIVRDGIDLRSSSQDLLA